MRYWHDKDEELHEYPYGKTSGEIHFRSIVESNIFEFVVLGQLSDGMWEDGPDCCEDWDFWWNLRIVVDGTEGWHSDTKPLKTDYDLWSLIEFQKDEIIDAGRLGIKGIDDQLEVDALKHARDYPNFDQQHHQKGREKLIKRFGSIEGAVRVLQDAEWGTNEQIEESIDSVYRSMNIELSS